MHSRVLRYEVWFSEDGDTGEVIVSVQAVDADGQSRWVADREFSAGHTWSDVAAWVWYQLGLDMPIGVG